MLTFNEQQYSAIVTIKNPYLEDNNISLRNEKESMF